MANTLRFKRGLVSTIPTALAGEPLFTTDTFDLYIGNGTTNTRFQKYIASGTTSQLLRGDGSLLTMPIVLTSPANGEVLKYNGTNWVNSSDAGVTGSGTAGQVTYWGSSSTITGSNNFLWDNTNNRLNINTAGATGSFTVNVRSSAAAILSLKGGASTNQGGALYITNANNSSTLAAFGDSATIAGGTPDLGAMIFTGTSIPLQFYVNGAERMRLFATGNLVINSTTDNGLRFQVTGDGYFSGSVGIGSTALTGFNLRIGKNIEGAVTSYGAAIVSTVQSGVTNSARIFYSEIGTQAASFTLPDINHFFAVQGTFGAGSTVTNQYGYRVFNNLTGATNNYGFYGDIASGTGRWNLYMNGTANNYMAGSLGIGTTNLTNRALAIGRTMTGSTTGYGILQLNTIASDVTASGINNYSLLATQAAAFTVTNAYNFFVADLSKGAGSTVTNQFGYYTANLTQGTNNYGFYGDIASGTGRWNLYMNGTANNYLAGSLGIGTTSLSNTNLNITKNLTGSANTYGIFNSGSILSGVTTGAQMFTSAPSIQNAVFTLAGLKHFEAVGISSVGSATITSQFGFYVESTLSGATNNYGFYGNIAATTGRWNIFMDGTANNFMRGSLLVGTSTTPTGEALQVTGTMKVTGASTFGGNLNLPNAGEYYLQNAASTTFIGLNFDTPYIRFGVGGTVRAFMNATGLGLGTASPSARLDVVGVSGTTIIRATGADSNGNADVEIRSTGTTGSSRLFFGDTAATSGSIIYNHASDAMLFSTAATTRATLDASGNLGIAMTPSYKLDVTGSARVSDAIAIGTTPDTNNPFKILKNINSTVGIRFENTNTSSAAFSAVQLGTDITGGTKFTNLVYSSAGVVATGVYNPDGTSLINNGSGGLNFLGTPFRIYTGTGNGTLRILFDNEGTTQINATAPTTNAVDGYKQYSADVVAGNAAPHFRTENGAVIKLYQETTSVGNSIFSQGGGNSVLDDSTFDGYTLRQIVKALRNQGILA